MNDSKKKHYIYNQKNTKLYKKKENKEENKMENGCASKVLAVGSSIELSSLP